MKSFVPPMPCFADYASRRQRDFFEFVAVEVATFWQVSLAGIMGTSRKRHFSLPRQCCWWVIREVSGAKYADIARHFNRDHTTVIHGVNWFHQRMIDDAKTKEWGIECMKRVRKEIYEHFHEYRIGGGENHKGPGDHRTAGTVPAEVRVSDGGSCRAVGDAALANLQVQGV